MADRDSAPDDGQRRSRRAGARDAEAGGERAPDAPTLNETAYRRLEEMIVTLELAPASVVSEAVLSERIGIGTTPIREALQRLAREYMVQILPRRGVIVTAIDVRLQLQVLETRRELDRLIARSAARRATTVERERFADIAQRIAASAHRHDIRGFLRVDDEMNQALSHAARNAVAAQAVAALHAVSRRFWFFHQEDDPLSEDTLARHAAVASAVAGGDETAAAAASDALIDHLFEFARRTLVQG